MILNIWGLRFFIVECRTRPALLLELFISKLNMLFFIISYY